jgi:hypothetical protein
MLADDTINIITNLDTNTDVCFIQKFSFEDGTHLTLGVHNEDNIGVEDVYKCFTATSWYFVKNNYKDVDTDNWRRSLAELISLAQKGESHE